MGSRVVEANGAQVLPRVGDERVTVSTFQVQSALSADQRTKSKPHAELAARMMIVKESR